MTTKTKRSSKATQPKAEPAPPTKHVLEAKNLGPIHQFTFEAYPGINEIRGGQESGKTVLGDAISAALGTKIPVQVSEGETEGYLRRDGAVMAEFKRIKGKAPYVSLASVSPIALVVDPRITGAESAEERRLRNLVLMSGLKTTTETIKLFLTPEPREKDDEPELDQDAWDYVEEQIGIENLVKLDPVAAADVLVKGAAGLMHKLRRRFEQKGDEWQGKCEVTAPKAVSEFTVEEAEQAYREAIGDEREKKGSAKQRAEREAERAEIEATLGERPDPEKAEQKLVDCQGRYDELAVQIMELEKQLAHARANATSAKISLDEAKKGFSETTKAAEQWDRRKAILDSEITGATEDDLARAAFRVSEAFDEVETARRAAEYQKQLQIAEEARRERDEARNRERQVAQLAENIPQRLGALFEEAGIPNARVSDGVLEIKKDGKWRPFQTYLSAGSKWRWALPIWAQHNPEGMLVLNKESWAELEEESKLEVAEIMREAGVIAFVEVTTRRGDPLHVGQFPAREKEVSSV
jgi:hypothetical protein